MDISFFKDDTSSVEIIWLMKKHTKTIPNTIETFPITPPVSVSPVKFYVFFTFEAKSFKTSVFQYKPSWVTYISMFLKLSRVFSRPSSSLFSRKTSFFEES